MNIDTRLLALAKAALIVLTIYLGALAIATFKGIQYIGSGVPATNTISVSGHGEIFAVPDTAEFTVSIVEAGKAVNVAQDKAAQKANAIIAYLKGMAVASDDIKTVDYTISPQYEYQSSTCPAAREGAPVYCPPGKQVLTGYEVSEALAVKVRDTDKAGDLLSGVGSRGASAVSGLTFTVADQQKLEADARDKAVADARAKAGRLAKSLGVSLVRIVGFSESATSPIPYAAKAMNFDAAASVAPTAPQIPTGQNKITSDVSLSYEIQ